jgi:hypothetical protein
MSHTRRIRNNMWTLFLIVRRSGFISCIAFLFLLYDTYTTTAHSQYVYIEIGRPDYFRLEARRSFLRRQLGGKHTAILSCLNFRTGCERRRQMAI